MRKENTKIPKRKDLVKEEKTKEKFITTVNPFPPELEKFFKDKCNEYFGLTFSKVRDVKTKESSDIVLKKYKKEKK